MTEHLTIQQMAEKYPERWLGLGNIKYVNNDGISIESADVIYTDKSKNELLAEKFSRGAIEPWYTSEEGTEILDVY